MREVMLSIVVVIEAVSAASAANASKLRVRQASPPDAGNETSLLPGDGKERAR